MIYNDYDLHKMMLKNLDKAKVGHPCSPMESGPMRCMQSPRFIAEKVTDLADKELEHITSDKLTVGTRSLLLFNNKFTTVPEFPTFHCLEKNRAGEWHTIALDISKVFDKLSLANNLLTRIENLCFLKQLKVLDLGENNISKIEGLHMLQSLEWLNLSGNRIEVIENLVELISLQYVNLSYNRITWLGNLSHLKHLKTLLLRGNHLASLDGILSFFPPSITALDLAENSLQDLSEMMLLHGLPVLEHLAISGNLCCSDSQGRLTTAFRHYILCWCKHLRVLDGIPVTHFDRQSARDLDLDGHIRTMQPGQHAKLMKYLSSVSLTFQETSSHAQVKTGSPSGLTKEEELAALRQTQPAWVKDTKTSAIQTLDVETDVRKGRDASDLELLDFSESIGTDSSMLMSESTYVPVLNDITCWDATDKPEHATEVDDLKSLSWHELLERDKCDDTRESENSGVSSDYSKPILRIKSRVQFTPPTIHLISPRDGTSSPKAMASQVGNIMTKPRLARPRKSPGRESHEPSTRPGNSSRYDYADLELPSSTMSGHSWVQGPARMRSGENDSRDLSCHVQGLLPYGTGKVRSEQELSFHMSEDEAFKLLNLAASLIQAHVRGFLQRKRFRMYLVRHRSAIRIQAAWKGFYVRHLNARLTKARYRQKQESLERRIATLEATLNRVTHCVEQQHNLIGELLKQFQDKVDDHHTLQLVLNEQEQERKRLETLSRQFSQAQTKINTLLQVIQVLSPGMLAQEIPSQSALVDRTSNGVITHGLVNAIIDGAYSCSRQQLIAMNGFAERLSHQIRTDAIEGQSLLHHQQQELHQYAVKEASHIVNEAICDASLTRCRRSIHTDDEPILVQVEVAMTSINDTTREENSSQRNVPKLRDLIETLHSNTCERNVTVPSAKAFGCTHQSMSLISDQNDCQSPSSEYSPTDGSASFISSEKQTLASDETYQTSDILRDSGRHCVQDKGKGGFPKLDGDDVKSDVEGYERKSPMLPTTKCQFRSFPMFTDLSIDSNDSVSDTL